MKKDHTYKESIIISRHWNNPEITVRVNSEKIDVDVSLEDFCKALVSEMPHPSLTMTRKSLEKGMLDSLETTINKIKEATNHN